MSLQSINALCGGRESQDERVRRARYDLCFVSAWGNNGEAELDAILASLEQDVQATLALWKNFDRDRMLKVYEFYTRYMDTPRAKRAALAADFRDNFIPSVYKKRSTRKKTTKRRR